MSALAVVAALYGVVLAALFAYGVNSYVLLARRRSWRAPVCPQRTLNWPRVTVQIPVYNERDVATRVIEAAGRLRYAGAFDVQVLDDSTDDTVGMVADAVAALRARGVEASHVRRGHRRGFKAGALADALALTDAPFLLLLDADFVPPEDLLERCIPHFEQANVACVQTRWGHLNRDASALTRGQALGIDVHFSVEQRARAAAGWPVCFNGSGGVWRRAAIDAAGGWSADTLTEDLDLSYRAWLEGYRVVYLDDVVCPAEIPEHIGAFKAQQRRWARGSTATARKLLGRIWRSPASVGEKLQATLHLTHYNVHPLMLASALLALPLGWLAPAHSSWWTLLPPLALATGGPLAMAMATRAERGVSRRGLVSELVGLMILGTGLTLSNTGAVLAGLRDRAGVFERTPKGGRRSSYAVADRLGVYELIAGALCAALAVWLVQRAIFSMAPFLMLYAAGLSCVGVATLREQREGATERPP
ncbi:MAG: glycosyltransferase [Deltaproteobacteria bacterium]|nr:glycosyltransferase [Deltaproteobacteria bacterium]